MNERQSIKRRKVYGTTHPKTPAQRQVESPLSAHRPPTAFCAHLSSSSPAAEATGEPAPGTQGIAPIQLTMASPPAITITQPSSSSAPSLPEESSPSPSSQLAHAATSAAAAAQLFAASIGPPAVQSAGFPPVIATHNTGTESSMPLHPSMVLRSSSSHKRIIQLPAGSALVLGDTLVQAVPGRQPVALVPSWTPPAPATATLQGMPGFASSVGLGPGFPAAAVNPHTPSSSTGVSAGGGEGDATAAAELCQLATALLGPDPHLAPFRTGLQQLDVPNPMPPGAAPLPAATALATACNGPHPCRAGAPAAASVGARRDLWQPVQPQAVPLTMVPQQQSASVLPVAMPLPPHQYPALTPQPLQGVGCATGGPSWQPAPLAPLPPHDPCGPPLLTSPGTAAAAAAVLAGPGEGAAQEVGTMPAPLSSAFQSRVPSSAEGAPGAAPPSSAPDSCEQLLGESPFPNALELAAALSLTPSQLALPPAKTWSLNHLLSLPSVDFTIPEAEQLPMPGSAPLHSSTQAGSAGVQAEQCQEGGWPLTPHSMQTTQGVQGGTRAGMSQQTQRGGSAMAQRQYPRGAAQPVGGLSPLPSAIFAEVDDMVDAMEGGDRSRLLQRRSAT